MDWHSRQIQPLFLEFLYKYEVATAKEMEEFFEI